MFACVLSSKYVWSDHLLMFLALLDSAIKLAECSFKRSSVFSSLCIHTQMVSVQGVQGWLGFGEVCFWFLFYFQLWFGTSIFVLFPQLFGAIAVNIVNSNLVVNTIFHQISSVCCSQIVSILVWCFFPPQFPLLVLEMSKQVYTYCAILHYCAVMMIFIQLVLYLGPPAACWRHRGVPCNH